MIVKRVLFNKSNGQRYVVIPAKSHIKEDYNVLILPIDEVLLHKLLGASTTEEKVDALLKLIELDNSLSRQQYV